MDSAVAQIVIEMNAQGQVEVKASESVVGNLILMKGLLGVAGDTLKGLHEDAQKRIQPASAAERLALFQGGKN